MQVVGEMQRRLHVAQLRFGKLGIGLGLLEGRRDVAVKGLAVPLGNPGAPLGLGVQGEGPVGRALGGGQLAHGTAAGIACFQAIDAHFVVLRPGRPPAHGNLD